MLTQVTSRNDQSGSLDLPLMDSSGGYVVKSITGLDPVKATLTSSPLAQIDGAQLQSKKRDARNIVIKLGFEPDFVSTTVSSLRSNLYKWFMPKEDVSLDFYMDGDLFVTIFGTVESCENDMFAQDPEVNISIMCYDPDFYASDPDQVSGMTVSDLTYQTITYDGSSETGVTFTITFPESATDITLYNIRPDAVVNQMDIQGAFQAGDILTVCTIPGKKSVTLTRSGVVSSILYYLDPSASWISLKRGDNLFRAEYSGSSLGFTLEYLSKYGGL